MARKLEAFHNRCLRGILGIVSVQHHLQHISSVQVAKQFGMDELLEDMIVLRGLRWLGHLARMDDHRLPKKILFGWLSKRHPAHGTMIRQRDQVKSDSRSLAIEERGWFRLAQDRAIWRGCCKTGLERVTRRRLEEDDMRRARLAVNANESASEMRPLECATCQRTFRRQQDINRHRCVTTRPHGQRARPPPSS